MRRQPERRKVPVQGSIHATDALAVGAEPIGMIFQWRRLAAFRHVLVAEKEDLSGDTHVERNERLSGQMAPRPI